MRDIGMKRIAELDQSEKRRRLIKNESLFQDTFSCVVGEHRCPIKKQNAELHEQLEIKSLEINTQQAKIEEIEKKANDDLLNNKDGKEKAEIIFKEIETSKAIAEREKKIKEYQVRVRTLQEYIDRLLREIKDLDSELEDFKTTAFEADIHQRRKVQEYRQLSKKCNQLVVRINSKEMTDKILDQAIVKKKAYDAELTKAVNRKVDELNQTEKKLAKLRVEHGRYEKVSQAVKENGKPKKMIPKIKFKLMTNKNAKTH